MGWNKFFLKLNYLQIRTFTLLYFCGLSFINTNSVSRPYLKDLKKVKEILISTKAVEHHLQMRKKNRKIA